MHLWIKSLLLTLMLFMTACKDYGEFTVAEREWVDNDELPSLEEMDLTGMNLEFSIGSAAHARVLPEVEWPDKAKAGPNYAARRVPRCSVIRS